MSRGAQLELSDITQAVLKQRTRLQQLYDDQFDCQRTLLNLGIDFDPTHKCVTVPEPSRIRYFEVFQKMKDIRDEINLTLSAIRAT